MKSPLTQLFGALALCIVSLVGYGVWYAYLGAESASIAEIQSKIDAKTVTAAHAASVRASLAEISGDEAAMQGYFVPETGIVTFIDSLEAYGRSQKAAVNILSVSSNTTGTHPAFVLALTVQGSFDAVMRTVGLMEYAPYDLSIAGLSLGEDAKNSWHANLTILVGSSLAAAASAQSASTSAPVLTGASSSPPSGVRPLQ